MEVGATTETVNVEGNASLINAVSSEQLNTIDMSKITELPIFRRNYTNLLALNTGVTMAAEGVRMNGVGKNGVSYTVDRTESRGKHQRTYTTRRALNTGVTMAAEGGRMNGVGKNGVSYTVDGTDAGGNPEGRYSS